jgi:DNA adenine methylase
VPGRFNLSTLEPMLEDVHARLAGVVIECLGYSEFIARYDRPGTLFYLDPPYWGCEDDYGKAMFAPEDFDRLAAQLKGIKGRFLMSINDVPEIRGLFGGFDIEEVQTSYTVGMKAGSRGRRGELLVSNKQ